MTKSLPRDTERFSRFSADARAILRADNTLERRARQHGLIPPSIVTSTINTGRTYVPFDIETRLPGGGAALQYDGSYGLTREEFMTIVRNDLNCRSTLAIAQQLDRLQVSLSLKTKPTSIYRMRYAWYLFRHVKDFTWEEAWHYPVVMRSGHPVQDAAHEIAVMF